MHSMLGALAMAPALRADPAASHAGGASHYGKAPCGWTIRDRIVWPAAESAGWLPAPAGLFCMRAGTGWR
jgi:hypothetical protein